MRCTERSSNSATLDSRAGNSAAVAVPTWCLWRRSIGHLRVLGALEQRSIVGPRVPGACWRARTAAPPELWRLPGAPSRAPRCCAWEPGPHRGTAPSTSMACREPPAAPGSAPASGRTSSADSFGSRAPSNNGAAAAARPLQPHPALQHLEGVLPVASGPGHLLPCDPRPWLTTACQRAGQKPGCAR